MVDEPLRPGALFQRRFLIERPLGSGGMGEVWAAVDTALERPVAIKILHRALAGEARYAARFLRETKLVARVAHPNIVRLYDAGATESGLLFMVMERVFGVPLRAMIAGGARLDPVRALHYAIQIADALSTAHEAALVHRDVKPENILVSDGAHARLLDFGVAKDGRGLALTRQGVAVGTSRYMAPEQITGSADARADLYALGVVMYEMLAGSHPYPVLDLDSAIGETGILAAHVYLEPTPLPEVLPGCPEALWRAVAVCLAKRPEERFARAAELAEELRAVAQASMPPEHPSAQRLRREAADAARAKAVRESAPGVEAPQPAPVPQAQPLPQAQPQPLLATTAPLPPGFMPSSPISPSAAARSRLAMAQQFEAVPTPGAVDPTARPVERPSALPVGRGAVVLAAPDQGPGASAVGSTERWTEAPAVLARATVLARTKPWEEARGAVVEKAAGAATTVTPQRRWWWIALSLATVLVAAVSFALLATRR